MADTEQQKKSESPKNIAKLLGFVFIAVNLGVNGLGLYWVYMATLGWTSPQINEQMLQKELASQVLDVSSVEPFMYTLEPFTVNLNGQPQRTLKLEVNLEMLNQYGFEEVMSPENKAKTRDKILRILNEKNFSDLESMQGKLFLKDQIAQEINSILDQGVVKNVYFSDLVAQ